jgi:hypothetical protein
LTGVWTFLIRVTEANGVCAGEEESEPSSVQIQITQSEMNLTLSGFLGNPANILTGSITLEAGAWIVTASGSYPEDSGITTTSYRMVLDGTSNLSGEESWMWAGPGGTCPDSKAEVTATKN